MCHLSVPPHYPPSVLPNCQSLLLIEGSSGTVTKPGLRQQSNSCPHITRDSLGLVSVPEGVSPTRNLAWVSKVSCWLCQLLGIGAGWRQPLPTAGLTCTSSLLCALGQSPEEWGSPCVLWANPLKSRVSPCVLCQSTEEWGVTLCAEEQDWGVTLSAVVGISYVLLPCKTRAGRRGLQMCQR